MSALPAIKPARNEHGQIVKGHSGNPLGRPSRKGINLVIDRLLGENAQEAIEFAAQVMRGEASAPARKPGTGEDAISAALIPLVGPTIRERLDAAQWLFEQRNGKAPQQIDAQISISAPPPDLSALSDEELARAESLLSKVRPAADVVDGEIVSG